MPEPSRHADEAALADGHHLARGAAANLLAVLAANFRGVFTFLIARLLGEAALGRFGIAWAATELLSKVGLLGLDGGIVPVVATRVAAGDPAGARVLVRRAIAIAVLASVAVLLVAWPLGTWLADVRGVEILLGGGTLMLLALPGIAAARIATGASRAVLAMGNEFYSRGLVETWVTIAVFVLALALGARGEAPSLAIVAGCTAGGIVACVLAARALQKPVASAPTPAPASLAGPERHAAISFAPARPSTRAMVLFSLPIAGSALLATLTTRLDVLILGAFVGRAPGLTVETFGVFCAAAELAVGLRKVRQVFDPVLGPVAARSSVDRARLRQTVAAPGRWVLTVQLPIVGVLILSGSAILAIFGDAFRQGAPWLALLAIAHGANSFVGLVETLLMIERPHMNLVNAVITIAVQVAASLVLIPRWGATGAALATCIGLSTQGLLRFRDVRRVFGWSWPWDSLRRPLLAFACAFVPSATVQVLADGFEADILSGLLFLALYALVWSRLGADPADRDVWRRLTASWRRG